MRRVSPIPNSNPAMTRPALNLTRDADTAFLSYVNISRAELMGSEARRLLQPGFRGKVLAVVSSTIYLMGEGGKVLWIDRGGAPAHRRSVSASFPPSDLVAGDPFWTIDRQVNIGGDLLLSLTSAAEWHSPAIAPERLLPLCQLALEIRALVQTLEVPEEVDGFSRVIPWLAGRSPLSSFPGRDAVEALGRACMACELERAVILARDLIGLGPGLTPSGDDFVGGFLFAANVLRSSYPGLPEGKEGAITDLITWAKGRTHEISHALLSDFSQGYGPEPLHALACALLEGGEDGGLVESAIRLTRIGHSSGWDILAGFLSGTLLTEKSCGPKL